MIVMKKYILCIGILGLVFVNVCRGDDHPFKNFFSVISTSGNTSIKKHRIATTAEGYIGKHYRRGVSAQCAGFVGHIITSCGYRPPNDHLKCTSWLNWGKRGSVSSLQRGDIIIYSRNRSGYNHIGIYDGNGKIIHRPTRTSPVRRLNYNYRSIISVRRPG